MEGYDVWLGNNRGTRHSRFHVNINPDYDSHFWDFSFVELGKYDLPALISFVIE
jgi:lysosomal acid lipase/cholesteryl ester hydrolase